MPVPLLPEDILQVILDSIRDKTSQPTRESQATFSALCLVSAQLLPLARARLYYRPVNPDIANPKSAATLLNYAVRSGDGKLGRLVRSLEGLGPWIAKTRARAEPHKDTPPYSLLSACREIHSLELALGSNSELEVAVEALRDTSCIKFFRLVPLETGLEEEEDLTGEDLVFDVLRLRPFRDVTSFELDLFCVSPEDTFPPLVELQLEKLSIDASYVKFPQVTQFFPTDPSYLKDFQIVLLCPEEAEVVAALSLLHSGMQRISFPYAPHLRHVGALSKYRNEHPPGTPLLDRLVCAPSIPIFALERFPQLVDLTLATFRGPSLLLLESLAGSSPLLRKLSFYDSYWVPTGQRATQVEALTDEEYYKLVFSEEEVARVLRIFPNLVSIHLGYLPVGLEEEADPIPTIRALARQQGIKVEWEPCSQK